MKREYAARALAQFGEDVGNTLNMLFHAWRTLATVAVDSMQVLRPGASSPGASSQVKCRELRPEGSCLSFKELLTI